MSSFSLFFTGRLSFMQTVLIIGLLLILTALYQASQSPISLVTFIIALAMGAVLNGLHFGFSRSFRELILERKTLAVRAIIWMLALVLVLFGWLQNTADSIQGEALYGFIRPVGVYSLLGAFLFGVGMQLGIGCTSGTLNRAGQLQVLSIPTLFMMIVGGTVAVWSQELWQAWPAIAPWAFQHSVHWLVAIAVQLLLLLVIYRSLLMFERSSNGQVQTLLQLKKRGDSAYWHPWLLAGLSLAALNALLFWVSGSPWSISSIFPYWGVHLIELLKLPVDWQFWDYVMENPNHLASEAINHTVSLTTWGVLFGALFVTLWQTSGQSNAKQNRSVKSVSHWRAWLVSSVAGFIMGLGAVMASGCNIGAFFSGIASGSLHGWVWLPAALIGNWAGLYLKRFLSL